MILLVIALLLAILGGIFALAAPAEHLRFAVVLVAGAVIVLAVGQL
jgi:hypothetical protein